MQLCLYHIKPIQPKQDWGQLGRLAHLLTQRAGLDVGVLHLGRCLTFGDYECRAKSDVQGQGLLGMLRRLWQGFEQPDPSGEVVDGFHMGRTVTGLLAGPLPVDYRLLSAARRGVVLGHQLWLRLHERGKPGF